MKKVLTLCMILALSLSMMACEDNEQENDVNNNVVIEVEDNEINETEGTEGNIANENDGNASDEVAESRTLEAIIDEIYEVAGLEIPKMMPTELTKENMAYMLGVDNFDYLEGLVSEPMMSSIAHSIVLFTVAEDTDIETIKNDIKENVDGRKWICVGVEDEHIQVEHVNNYVILIMDASSDVYVDAFYQVMK